MSVVQRFRRRRPETMTVVEHLDELRTRLVIAIGAIGLGSIGGWFLFGPVTRLLENPYCAFMNAHPNLAADPKDPCKLVFLGVAEPFLLKLKVTVFLGLAIALPIVLYELWRFITPGLTERERRYGLPFVFCSVLLFVLGGWFALITLPKGLNFLLGFAGSDRVLLLLTFPRYLSFVMLMILAFGVSFEFPLVLISLTLVGILSSRKLRDVRRYAILGIAVFAAVVTPSQDWFTMTAMMVPLILFYELAIIVARLLRK